MAVTRIQFRRGTAAEWAAENPVLNSGEPGVETDTEQVKVGDGITAWNGLGYMGSPADAMDPEEAEAGVSTTPRTISADVLAGAIASLSAAANFANVHMQPIWDGTGAHPLRPDGLPDNYFEIWRQPTAPLAGEGLALDGDEWEVTEGAG